MFRRAILPVLALLAVGCNGEKAASRNPAPPAPAHAWKLINHDAAAKEPALLWNGLLGLRIGRNGTFAVDGAALPLFSISNYEMDGEEKIVPIPNPFAGSFFVNDVPLDPLSGSDYLQELDMATGILLTRWKQADTEIEVETVLHPVQRILGQSWRFKAPPKARITGRFISPEGAVIRKEERQVLWTDWRLGPESHKVQSSIRLNGQEGWIERKDGVLLEIASGGVVETVVSLGESPKHWKILEKRGVAVRLKEGWDEPPSTPDYGTLVAEVKQVWQERWRTDIEIDGPIEDQQAIRSFLFYLRSAIAEDGSMSISPMGLSSTHYFGHVFWDADMWVFPALSLIEPAKAAAITEYRLSTRMGARENYLNWVRNERPTGTDRLGPATPSPDAVKFAWESSVSGRETVPGPSRFQDHISASVVQSATWAEDLGFVDSGTVEHLAKQVASFYLQRIDASQSPASLIGTMSPDENHIGDNDLYTNLLVNRVFQRSGSEVQMALPRDSTTFLTYDADPLRAYKQAAAVLSIYPVQHAPAEDDWAQMMKRFEEKVTRNGPAMTDSVHATIHARFGDPNTAYKVWHDSWKPFTKQPLLLFSEKRTTPRTYFTTGAAGSLSAVIYGFLGFRLDSEQEQEAAWSKKLQGETWLSVKPKLPSTWKSVKFKNFKLLGQSYTLTASPTETKVVQGD